MSEITSQMRIDMLGAVICPKCGAVYKMPMGMMAMSASVDMRKYGQIPT